MRSCRSHSQSFPRFENSFRGRLFRPFFLCLKSEGGSIEEYYRNRTLKCLNRIKYSKNFVYFSSTGVDYVDKSVDIWASTKVEIKNGTTGVDKISEEKGVEDEVGRSTLI